MSSNLTKAQAIEKLWRLGNLEWKLRGIQREMRKAIVESPGKRATFLVSRRSGKCLAEGTMILTTKGMKPIEEIQLGEYVYGYNIDGSISPVQVTQLYNQGIQEVYDLVNNNRILETCTDNHQWLVNSSTKNKKLSKKLKDFAANDKICRYFIKSDCGDKHFEQAYSLGALLGDGCSKQGINSIYISSEDKRIPERISQELGCDYYRQNEKNYTWVLSYNKKLEGRGHPQRNKHKYPPKLNYFNDWCKDRYAHKKIVDLDVVKTWNRETCLNFLAGLIDTDGSVRADGKRLNISYYSQSKSLVESVQFLLYQLFQFKAEILVDNRTKYKNGPIYEIHCFNNLFAKNILKELSNYLILDRKKWKDEYETYLENNSNKDYVGVKKVNKRRVQCYDIGVNNETHLYLTANGLVTHNSFTMCTVAVETCIKTPNSIVKYVCPKQKMVKTIVNPIMRVILDDCPIDLKPEYKEADKVYRFPNGSEIQFAGSDSGNIENLRGGFAHLCLLDEAGFIDDLNYAVYSVLSPTTKTTGGKLVLASTPSREPDHEFMSDFVNQAEAEGKLIKYTIYNNPMFTEEVIQETIDEYPLGKDDPQFRREYLCESAIDAEVMVIPEFTEALQRDIIRQVDIPPHFDIYVSGDPAARDLTVLLFGYYDFINSQLVVLDELVLGGSGVDLVTQDIADGIRRKEKLLFTNKLTGEVKEPYLRVMDNNNLILVNDLFIEHGLNFIPTAKDNKEAQINKTRMWLKQGRIIIHPRCINLKYHIQMARWDKDRNGNRKGFQRVKASSDGNLKANHCDGLDALLYMVRNIDVNRNPYPSNFFEMAGENIFHPYGNEKNISSNAKEIMHGICGKKKKNN